ncbi:MAG: ComF family protein [Pseudomonadales bacterium]|jgi:ComF family protein|nr:ComF family protein [Pseudomonadales bacterium]MDP4766720.1 ComF family protein [Pseudomonadales bacterium]MDP4875852.1 ComF family protein [Pseudomonadales bacterium]MDP5058170.1 ComF family protein [Pseudomonadales bacterium]
MLELLAHWSYSLFPGKCMLCLSASERRLDLCRACEADLPTTPWPCVRCGQQALPANIAADIPLNIVPAAPVCHLCRMHPPPFRRTFSAFAYSSPVDQLISEFKTNHQHRVGYVLAMVLAQRYQCWCQAQVAATTRVDLLVPMPLHKRRQRQRGFNQATEISQCIGRLNGIAVDTRLCRRVKATNPQKGLSAAARQQNIQQAFVVGRRLHGLRVAIVDDVLTTGATVAELSRMLLRAGASSVDVITLARTAPPRFPRNS